MNSNRAIITNTQSMVEGELEDQVIAIAQDFIDESRSTTFDEETTDGGVPVNIPSGFTANLGPEAGEATRANFDDFDDYDGWTQTITTSGGVDYEVSISVDYYDGSNVINSFSTLKIMEITISSDILENNGSANNYHFKFLRSFYADWSLWTLD